MATGRIRQMVSRLHNLQFPTFVHRAPGYYHPKNWWEYLPDETKFPVEDTLLNTPDWTYVDGRPSPLNEAQLTVKKEQIELGKDIVKNLKEIKQAEAEFREHLRKEHAQAEALEKSKPRAKGKLYRRSVNK